MPKHVWTTHVGHPRCLRGYLVEQDAGDRGEVASGGSELRQNRLPSRDQRIHDRHGWPAWPQLPNLKPATCNMHHVVSYVRQQDSRHQ